MPGVVQSVSLPRLRCLGRVAAGLILLVCLAGPATAISVELIPSPRPEGWTVDLTSSLTPEDVHALNRLSEEVHQQTGAEVAVVVVGSTDGTEPREFATRLFNHWGIGQRGADNGILLFAALDDRAAEIVLGIGIDTQESRRVSEEIMQGEMLPLFRDGNVAGALLRGVDGAARRILGASPSSGPGTNEIHVLPTLPDPSAPEAVPAAPQAPAMPRSYRPGLVGLLLLAGAGIVILLSFRLVPPRCRECRIRMVKLTETGDDLHLEPFEQTEERIGSVNHDVWLCNGCGNIVKRRRLIYFSGYNDCPKCSARTLRRQSTQIEQATYSHGGQVRVDETCAQCDHRSSHTYATARLERSSSSSVSSSSSFRSSGSSGSSSRSSGSSRSGFGGGRSSGGGASGRW